LKRTYPFFFPYASVLQILHSFLSPYKPEIHLRMPDPRKTREVDDHCSPPPEYFVFVLRLRLDFFFLAGNRDRDAFLPPLDVTGGGLLLWKGTLRKEIPSPFREDLFFHPSARSKHADLSISRALWAEGTLLSHFLPVLGLFDFPRLRGESSLPFLARSSMGPSSSSKEENLYRLFPSMVQDHFFLATFDKTRFIERIFTSSLSLRGREPSTEDLHRRRCVPRDSLVTPTLFR